jgi:archaellum component FlaC
MKELIITGILSALGTFVAGGSAWLWQNKRTKKQKQQESVDIINSAIAKMIESERVLIEHNSILVTQLSESNRKTQEYYQEIITLKGRIERLTMQVSELTKEINFLRKNVQ